MNNPSFKKISQLTAESTKIARQNEEIAANQLRDIQMKAQYLEIERMKFEAEKHSDIRHQVNQCVDFAIRSLPWWKRSTRTVVDRASEYLLTIKHEVGKHVAMDVLTQRLENEADNEKITATVNTVSVNQNGDTEIHATMDREGAELEQV